MIASPQDEIVNTHHVSESHPLIPSQFHVIELSVIINQVSIHPLHKSDASGPVP